MPTSSKKGRLRPGSLEPRNLGDTLIGMYDKHPGPRVSGKEFLLTVELVYGKQPEGKA